tara:strand:- start:3530 stop:4915 length:1386 start_codon:yes stop_codon:yes gene_type:complete
MATTIVQAPLYPTLPVGQDIIFAAANNDIVANQVRVKFIAEVHISNQYAANQNTTTDLVGTFKTTPNNAGVGMFDLSSVVESYVTADNVAGIGSRYKGTTVTSLTQDLIPPMHLIDKYSHNTHSMRWLTIRFKVEYLDADDTSATYNQVITSTEEKDSDDYRIFNGYLKYTDKLDIVSSEFGYSMGNFQLGDVNKKFLTNASITQYANIEDYGTIAFLDLTNDTEYIKLTYLNAEGATEGTDKVYPSLTSTADIRQLYLYFGCYPANLRNWSATFNTNIADITHYTIQAFDDADAVISKEYTVNINCPTLKGYVPIRLAWLNQWGAWDYYTFTQKSVKNVSTKGSTYTQQSGTWNKAAYRVNGYKGGQKSFRVNATEKISMNTDFVNETESQWFEELINSPEVYVLSGYEDISEIYSVLNQYVTPVRLLTSSYTKKTVANDKLMQYTFEVEKSKTLRTQAV